MRVSRNTCDGDFISDSGNSSYESDSDSDSNMRFAYCSIDGDTKLASVLDTQLNINKFYDSNLRSKTVYCSKH